MMVTDKVFGSILVGGTSVVLLYYTVWVIGLPFVDKDQEFIHSWFPDHKFALAIPLFAGTVGLVSIGLYVLVMTMKEKSKDHED